MEACKQLAVGLALTGLLAFVVGCGGEPEKPLPLVENTPPKMARPINRTPSKPEKVTEKIDWVQEPPPSTIPRVTLTSELLATCLVKVGDQLPDAELSDITGKTQRLTKLYGRKLTVVFIWTADSEYAEQALEDLDGDVAKPFAEEGVNVVGINLRNDRDKVRDVVQKTAAAFPILLDTDGKYFAKIATDKPLRIYLLDPQGKILWFDVECSRSTRSDLLQAIQSVVAKKFGALPNSP